MRTRAPLLLLVLGLVPSPAGSYTFQGNTDPDNGGLIRHASLPVTYRYHSGTSDAQPSITAGSDPRGAIDAGFAEWAGESGISVTLGADTGTASVSTSDDINLITFADTATNRDLFGSPCEFGPLAITRVAWNGSNAIQDADIVFSPCQTWSTTGTEDAFPIASVGTHEIGHFFGLDHSVVGAATMYPFASDYGHFGGSALGPATLTGDDRAAANVLHPDAAFAAKTGGIEGDVRRDGSLLYGAHVVATRVSDGIVFGADITRGSNEPADEGHYLIENLPPGTYLVHAEPADGPTTHGNWDKPGCPGSFWYGCAFPTDWKTSYLGGNGSPTMVSVTAGSVAAQADLVVTDGAPLINPDRIGLSDGFSLPRSGIPVTVAPGATYRVVAEDSGEGLTESNLTALACSDPSITISMIEAPIEDKPYLFWFDAAVPADAIPGPRSLVFATASEVALLTGFFEVSGPSDETVCDDGVDDDGDGCTDCDDSDCDGDPDCEDQCPGDPDKLQPGVCGCGTPDTDTDDDGVADCVDPCPADDPDDSDSDGVCDSEDLCPGFDDGIDSDSDGTPDGCDDCPEDPDKTEPGACGCGVSDADLDDDGVPDCCVAGDVWPDGTGDDLVDLRDWAQAVHKSVIMDVAVVDHDLTCGDVGPAASACLPTSGPRRSCPSRDGGFTAADADVIRGLAAGTDAVSCSACLSDRHVPGGDLRRVGDVAPRAEGGDGTADVSDVLLVLNWAVDNLSPPLPGDEEFLRADVAPHAFDGELLVVQGNDDLNVSDVLALLRHAVDLDPLGWPKRTGRVSATGSPGSFEGFQALLSGWDAYAESFSFTPLSDACTADAGLDALDDLSVVTCLGSSTSGDQDLFDIHYRAPEGAAPAATELTLIEADFDLVAGTAMHVGS